VVEKEQNRFYSLFNLQFSLSYYQIKYITKINKQDLLFFSSSFIQARKLNK
jgi:hypothetical protein